MLIKHKRPIAYCHSIFIIVRESAYILCNGLFWFGLVYLFIHSVTHVTLDTSVTDYNSYITTQIITYRHPPDIM